MPRYIATVEYDAGEYWISFPGIAKAFSHAKRVEDIVPHACNFLSGRTKYGGSPPPSLDDALSAPIAPFEGTKLVIFEWEPPPRTGYRIVGYEDEELVLTVQVPAEKIDAARALARSGSRPLSGEDAKELGVIVPPGVSYFLEADPETAA
jgi:hypothetical protein